MDQSKNFPEKPGAIPRDVKHTIWIAVGMVGLVLIAAIIAGAASGKATEIISLIAGSIGEVLLILIVAAGSYTFGVFHRTLIEERRKRKLEKAEENKQLAIIAAETPTPPPPPEVKEEKQEEPAAEEAAPEIKEENEEEAKPPAITQAIKPLKPFTTPTPVPPAPTDETAAAPDAG